MKILAVLVAGLLIVFGALQILQEPPADPNTDTTTEPADETALPFVCPPCGMGMGLDSSTQMIDGHFFAICNARCAALVAAAPSKYLAQAIPEVAEPEGE